MALNPKRVQFLIDSIQGANSHTMRGSISQLFEHLHAEIKDNPLYDKYISEMGRWTNWPDDVSDPNGNWEMPTKFDDAKSLSYCLYKNLTTTGDLFNDLFNITSEDKFSNAIHSFNNMFIGYFAKALEDIMNANPELESEAVQKVAGTRVFIIHGHDDSLKEKVQLLLGTAGVNYVVLHEQPDKGRTIIDKLIEEGNESNYAIGLLTADDITQDGSKRARQNVILEIGYFLGQLGKERVRMLVGGNIEIPSDLAGILYEKYDDAGAWRMKILKELMAVGIYVDLKAVIAKS